MAQKRNTNLVVVQLPGNPDFQCTFFNKYSFFFVVYGKFKGNFVLFIQLKLALGFIILENWGNLSGVIWWVILCSSSILLV